MLQRLREMPQEAPTMDLPDDFPKTELEFEAKFSDEGSCREYLFRVRWPEGFRCPSCQGAAGWALKGRDLIECAGCGRQTSLTAGTVLHGTRKPLRLWFRAMFLMSAQKSGLSARNFMRLMGLKSYQTAWTWLHKLRKAMVRPERPKLEGHVEVDEMFVGGIVEGCCGRGTTKPMVAVAVERLDDKQLGRVRMEVVEDDSQASLFTFVCNNVSNGAQVTTDGLAGYNELGEAGYDHDRKVVGADRKRASKLLPAVHRVIALVKRWILGTHQGAVSEKHLPAYLQEYTFRFNRRRSSHPVKLFHRLAEGIMRMGPTTYDQLVAAKAA